MGASPIVKQVYREHAEHFGEPDDSIVCEDDEAPYGRPARIDIFVWRGVRRNRHHDFLDDWHGHIAYARCRS